MREHALSNRIIEEQRVFIRFMVYEVANPANIFNRMRETAVVWEEKFKIGREGISDEALPRWPVEVSKEILRSKQE